MLEPRRPRVVMSPTNTPDTSPSTDEGSRHSSRVSALSPPPDHVVPLRFASAALPQTSWSWWAASQGLDNNVLQKMHDDILDAAARSPANLSAQADQVLALTI